MRTHERYFMITKDFVPQSGDKSFAIMEKAS